MISLTAFDRWYIITLLPPPPPSCPPHRPVLSTRTLSATENKTKKGSNSWTQTECTHCGFFFFSSICKTHFSLFLQLLIGHVELQHRIPSPPPLLFLCHEDGCSHCLLWWSEAGPSAISGKGGRRARGRRSAQSESCFSHQGARSNATHIAYHNKHIWGSLILLQNSLNALADTIHQRCSIKNTSKCNRHILLHPRRQYWISSLSDPPRLSSY